MNDITHKKANEILSHYTDLGYGVVIEGEDTSKIKQALSLARKALANNTPYSSQGDCISREALKKELQENGWITDDAYGESGGLEEIIDNAPTVDNRDYSQGWHDAITKALNEAYTFTTDDGTFKVVQVETLEGLGMSIPKRPQGEWIFVNPLQANDGGAYMCSNCKTGDYGVETYYKYCPFCGAEMRKGGKE